MQIIHKQKVFRIMTHHYLQCKLYSTFRKLVQFYSSICNNTRRNYATLQLQTVVLCGHDFLYKFKFSRAISCATCNPFRIHLTSNNAYRSVTAGWVVYLQAQRNCEWYRLATFIGYMMSLYSV